jgi:hypothetical protein
VKYPQGAFREPVPEVTQGLAAVPVEAPHNTTDAVGCWNGERFVSWREWVLSQPLVRVGHPANGGEVNPTDVVMDNCQQVGVKDLQLPAPASNRAHRKRSRANKKNFGNIDSDFQDTYSETHVEGLGEPDAPQQGVLEL